MENYIKNFAKYNNIIVYDFNVGDGGLGDYIKYFLFVLTKCIKEKKRLYMKVNNHYTEKYIRLIHNKMYANEKKLKFVSIKGKVTYVKPKTYWGKFNYEFNVKVSQVFKFSKEVIKNESNILKEMKSKYISLHIRLGDKFLEIDPKFVKCKSDVRDIDEMKILKFIENNSNKNILLFCDNKKYKKNMNKKYNNIYVCSVDIGHTCFKNTTDKQTLDSITEMYIMSKSEEIYAGTNSGFSKVASLFERVPYIKIHDEKLR